MLVEMLLTAHLRQPATSIYNLVQSGIYPPKTDMESCTALVFIFSAVNPSFSLPLTASSIIVLIASSSAPSLKASRRLVAGAPYRQVLNSPVAESRILLQV